MKCKNYSRKLGTNYCKRFGIIHFDPRQVCSVDCRVKDMVEQYVEVVMRKQKIKARRWGWDILVPNVVEGGLTPIVRVNNHCYYLNIAKSPSEFIKEGYWLYEPALIDQLTEEEDWYPIE